VGAWGQCEGFKFALSYLRLSHKLYRKKLKDFRTEDKSREGEIISLCSSCSIVCGWYVPQPYFNLFLE
jgi:hypothetical protein